MSLEDHAEMEEVLTLHSPGNDCAYILLEEAALYQQILFDKLVLIFIKRCIDRVFH